MARVQWAQGRFAAGQLQTPSAALCSLNRRNTFCDEKKNAACLATQSSQTQQDHVFHTSGEKPTQRFFALQGVRTRRGEQSLETLEVFSFQILLVSPPLTPVRVFYTFVVFRPLYGQAKDANRSGQSGCFSLRVLPHTSFYISHVIQGNLCPYIGSVTILLPFRPSWCHHRRGNGTWDMLRTSLHGSYIRLLRCSVWMS